MIQTIRDAESKIWILQRELKDLKEKTHRFHEKLETVIKELQSVQTANSNNGSIDSILSADGSQVSHRLFHIFEKLKTKELEVEKLTATDIETDNLETDDLTVNNDLDVVNVNASGNVTAGNTVQGVNVIASSNTTTGTLQALSDSRLRFTEVWGTSSKEALHVSSTDDNRGFNVVILGDNVLLVSGCRWAGGWIATAANASIISMSSGGSAFIFYGNSGLTPGVGFGPTVVGTFP